MALSYNLGYQESISVHSTRRQIFAGKPYSTFPNIWEWLISSVCVSSRPTTLTTWTTRTTWTTWTTWTIWTSCPTSITLIYQTTPTEQRLIKKIFAEYALFTWSCFMYYFPLFLWNIATEHDGEPVKNSFTSPSTMLIVILLYQQPIQFVFIQFIWVWFWEQNNLSFKSLRQN